MWKIKEKLFVAILVTIEAFWIALLFCCFLAFVQVITARAATPYIDGKTGEWVIEIDTKDNAIDITEPPTQSNASNALNALETAPPINDVSIALNAQDETVAGSTVYGDISLSQEDFDLLRRIMALEGHSEGHEGLKGICEVVFNRMRSDRFPDTLQDVIYQKGQFATVRYLKNPYVLPGEAEDDAISEVLRETETVLPSTDYVFFSRGKSNGRAFIKINHHWFSR